MGGRAGNRVAGVGAAEAAGVGRVHDVGAARDGGERKAAREALGQGHDVGLYARVLEPEQLAGARKARLWISSAMSRMPCSSHSARSACEEIGRRDVETAFALHGLDDDGGDGRGVGLVFEQGLRAPSMLSALEVPW